MPGPDVGYRGDLMEPRRATSQRTEVWRLSPHCRAKWWCPSQTSWCPRPERRPSAHSCIRGLGGGRSER